MNIGCLRGHVAQLTQSISQFALRPGDEDLSLYHILFKVTL
jgi:hypothetical protein